MSLSKMSNADLVVEAKNDFADDAFGDGCRKIDELARRLAKAEARAEAAEAAVAKAREAAEDAPELNMRNYDEDQVSHLNAAMIEVWKILKEAT